MRRNLLGKVIFAAALSVAGVAQAQTTPLTNNPQTGIQGTLSGGSTFNTGSFTTWAFIASTLQFDVTDSTLDCGTVTTGSGSAVACSYPAGDATAQITVDSNADWAITMNDGTTYDTAPAKSNLSTMTSATSPSSGFLLHLSATNGANGNSDATGVQPPNPAAVVTISASYDQSTSTTQDVTKVDAADEYGDYLGDFVVVLHEI